MKSATICLTWSEMLHAAQEGARRQIQNLGKGRHDRYGAELANGWQLHISGTTGELAVAKYLNVYWDGMGALGKLDAPDARGTQVRWTEKPTNRLILHPADDDNLPFVLVTSEGFRFTLLGWLFGRHGKLPQYWTDPTGNGRAAFFVPQTALQPMPDLRAYLSEYRTPVSA